jgi:hypothetical protein
MLCKYVMPGHFLSSARCLKLCNEGAAVCLAGVFEPRHSAQHVVCSCSLRETFFIIHTFAISEMRFLLRKRGREGEREGGREGGWERGKIPPFLCPFVLGLVCP